MVINGKFVDEKKLKYKEIYSMLIYFHEQNKADEFYEVRGFGF